MDTLESAAGATKNGNQVNAVCWECGEMTTCIEYIVCCTGTLFHICPACEAKVNDGDSCAAPTGNLPADHHGGHSKDDHATVSRVVPQANSGASAD